MTRNPLRLARFFLWASIAFALAAGASAAFALADVARPAAISRGRATIVALGRPHRACRLLVRFRGIRQPQWSALNGRSFVARDADGYSVYLHPAGGAEIVSALRGPRTAFRTAAPHGLKTGDTIRFYDIRLARWEALNNTDRMVARIDGRTFEIPYDSSGHGPYFRSDPGVFYKNLDTSAFGAWDPGGPGELALWSPR